MKRILTALVLLTGLFGAGGAVWAGDYDKCSDLYFDEEDFAAAFKECRPLAEQGNAEVQQWLGNMYAKGNGVTKNYAEAAKWYRKAAEQGREWAQYHLGQMYLEGNGVTKNYAEAAKWYHKSAEQGVGWAQYQLGQMYEKGHGVLQDLSAAHMWYNIAAVNVIPFAEKNRDRVAGKLPSSELAEALKRAKRCMESKYKDCEAEPKSWWQKLKD